MWTRSPGASFSRAFLNADPLSLVVISRYGSSGASSWVKGFVCSPSFVISVSDRYWPGVNEYPSGLANRKVPVKGAGMSPARNATSYVRGASID
jgi:hypothetical protein